MPRGRRIGNISGVLLIKGREDYSTFFCLIFSIKNVAMYYHFLGRLGTFFILRSNRKISTKQPYISLYNFVQIRVNLLHNYFSQPLLVKLKVSMLPPNQFQRGHSLFNSIYHRLKSKHGFQNSISNEMHVVIRWLNHSRVTLTQ